MTKLKKNLLVEKNVDDIKIYIVLCLLISYLIYLYNYYGYLQYYLQYYQFTNLSVLNKVIPIILCPIGLKNFYKNKRSGWIILTGLLVQQISNIVYDIYFEIQSEEISNDSSSILNNFDFLLPKRGYDFYITKSFFGLLLLIFWLYFNKQNTRKHFNINTQTFYITNIFSIILVIIFLTGKSLLYLLTEA